MKLVRPLGLVLSLLALDPGAAAQEARSPFDAATVVLPATAMPFRRLLDFDLDGDPDAVTAQLKSTRDEYRLALVVNDGGILSGHAFGSSTTPDDPTPFLIQVGHLNGDAFPDVCIVHGAERHDWLTIRDRPRQFSLEQQAPILLPAPATTLALADLDGDGIDDVLWTDEHHLRLQTSSGPKSTILLGGEKHGLFVLLGSGPFGSHVVLANVTPPPRERRTGDDVHIFYGNRSTGLVAGPFFATGVVMSMLDTGDVDGDADSDAVVFGMKSYRILRRLTRGSWTLEPELAGGPAASLHDVDGDGDLDGVCCSSGGGGGNPGTYEPNVLPSDFQISLNDGSGGFAPSFAIPGVGSPELAGVVDVDRDGDADLVAGRCVYYARGPVRRPGASPVVPPSRGPRALSDFDGDGDIDVGFSLDSVYANDGRGAFTRVPREVRNPVGATLRGPGYTGDFDGDGDVDLLVEARPGRALAFPSGSPGMVMLCNDGRGGLADPLPAAARGVTFGLDSADPERSLLVDADLDGDLDLLTRTATIQFGVAHSRLWANQGAGRFRDGGSTHLRALWMGDVDLDGDMDLIGCGAGYEGTSTYLDLGSQPRPGQLPTFTWSGVSWHQRVETGIVAGDWDNDGFIDFGTHAETWSQGVIPPQRVDLFPLILENKFGVGRTLREVAFTSEDLTEDFLVDLSDLDGDSQVDLFYGPRAAESVPICEVRFGRGHGLFRSGTTLQLVPPGLLVDLDGDGDRDVLGERITFNLTAP